MTLNLKCLKFCYLDKSYEVWNNDSLIGSDESNCTDKEHWSGYPECVPKQICILQYNNTSESIVNVKNAFIINDTNWLAINGTTVHFQCNEGFVFFNKSVLTCNNGTWDLPTTVCIPISHSSK